MSHYLVCDMVGASLASLAATTSHVAGSVLIIGCNVARSRIYDVSFHHRANLFRLCNPFEQRKFVPTAF